MSFNFEDKIKWSELSPSLQKRFTDVENLVKSQAKSDLEGQLNGTRITIGKRAPSNPINDKELWIDEKYRIARAFDEKYWEFTRAVWAKSSTLTTPSDPSRVDKDLTGTTGGGTYTPPAPTERMYDLFTYTDNGSTANLAGSTESTKTDQLSGEEIISYSFLGENTYVTISITMTEIKNSDSDLLAYLFLIVGDISDQDKSHATGYVYAIEKDKLIADGFEYHIGGTKLNKRHIYTLKLDSSIIKKGKYIMGEVESLRRGAKQLEYVDPGDVASSTYGCTKFDTSQYPYSYPISTLTTPPVIGYTDEGGSKPRPPFKAVNGNLTISISVHETR